MLIANVVLIRSGKKFNIALLLSIFVGWLGIDRFYLGYPALGQYVYLFESKCSYCVFCFVLEIKVQNTSNTFSMKAHSEFKAEINYKVNIACISLHHTLMPKN